MKINTAEAADPGLQRIGAYGKLWGVLNYFHPVMGKGSVDGDSLFLKNIGQLLTDPSEANFKQSLDNLLIGVNDPQSVVITTANKDVGTVLTARNAFGVFALPGNLTYIALPQTAFNKFLPLDSILLKSRFKKVIVDLRSASINNDLGIKQYRLFVQPLIASMLNRSMILPTERSFFYKGLMRQDFPQDINLFDPDNYGNVAHLQVHQGLKNIAEGAYLLPEKAKKYSADQYCFVINRYTNVNSVKAVMALRNRGACRVVFDGRVPEYLYGTFYYQELPGGLTAKVRTSEVIYEDGTLGAKPDLIFEGKSDTSLNGLLIQNASMLLKRAGTRPGHLPVENTVFFRKPVTTTISNGTPDAAHRLLGLFNFWNTIHFFSPNKNLIAVDWETSLPYFVKQFLEADTDDKYFMALMELTAAIKDGHGILMNKLSGRSPKGFMDGNLPFACEQIDDKVYVTSIMPDPAQKTPLEALHYGDEVLAIDGIPVNSIISKWEPLLVASNSAGFRRELYATWFTAGSVGSKASVTVLQDGLEKTIILNRINRNDYYNLWGKVIRPMATPAVYPPNWKILDGNVGYIRMNRIYTKELDSVAMALKGCEKIVIDARGYPRDGSIGTNLAAYIARKTDTVSYDVFPFVTSPDLSKRQMLMEYAVIVPNANVLLKDKQYFLLVDEGIQSQGEWNVIAIQGVTKATTIGRTTAGANGMAVTVTLPGNYMTFFSGFGEYYMDHTPNQKNGVKLDLEVKKTLKAAINGTDDILARALLLIKGK
ncbi:S41 family peptidase [Pedobacter sp. PWIIR3]